jgi:glucose/arabinose dehydrogenase
MTPAGKPVAGPSLVYATGLHNVQGFAWDQDDQLFAVDSADSGDGVIPIRLSGDYGWPPSSRSEGDATVQPIQTFPLAQGGCAGVAAVQQILATACLTGQRVWLMQLAGTTVFGSPQAGLTQAFGRLRTVVAAPDGSLWITTSNTDGHGKPTSDDDQIIRVVIADEGAGKS